MVGIGTIFVCGTPTMVARSLSVVTITKENFRAPPSLIVMVAPPGTNLEEFFQGFSRGTGDFLESLKILGQVIILQIPLGSCFAASFWRLLLIAHYATRWTNLESLTWRSSHPLLMPRAARRM